MAGPTQQELNDILIEQLRSLNVLDTTRLENLRNISNEEYKLIDFTRKRLQQLKEIKETSEAIFTDIEEQYKITDMEYKIRQKELKIKEDELRISYKNKILSKEEYIQQMKVLLASEDKLNIDKEGYAVAKKLADLLGVAPKKDSFLARLQENPKEFFDGLKKGIEDYLNVTNLANSVMEKFIEASISASVAQDVAQKASNRTTGQVDMLNISLMNATNNLAGTGIGAEEAGKAYTSLFQDVNTFNKESISSQAYMIETVSLLENMGISAEQSAKNIGQMTRVFKMTGSQAALFQTRFSSLANSLEMDVGQIISGFDQVSETMYAVSSSPDELAESFGKLAKVSKNTGISIEGIVKITERFDTFEGAAEQVGKLNSILQGPYLSTLEMIQTTDPAERMMKISQAIRQSGKSFDQLSYYEKKAYKDALGLETMADLASVMAGNVDNIGDPMANMDEQSLLEMKAKQAAFNDVMQSFDNLLKSVVIGLGPLVTGFAALMDVLAKIGPYISPIVAFFATGKVIGIMAEGIKALIPGITGLSFSFGSLTAAIGRMNAVQKGNLIFMFISLGASILSTVLPQYSEFASIISNLAIAFGLLSGAIFALGASEKSSLLLSGAGAVGLMALAYAFDYFSVGAVEGHSPAWIFAIIALGMAFRFMSKLINSSMSGIMPLIVFFAALSLTALAIGASFMMIGKGFELVGISIKTGAEGFKLLAETINDISVLKILAVTAAIYKLADAMSDIPLLKTLAMTAMIAVSSMAADKSALGVESTGKAIASGVAPTVSPAAGSLTSTATAATIAASNVTINTSNEVVTNKTNTSSVTNTSAQSAGSQTSGKPAELVFNLQLSIDGTQFTKAVNKVKVDPMKDKALYDSIRDMIQKGMGV